MHGGAHIVVRVLEALATAVFAVPTWLFVRDALRLARFGWSSRTLSPPTQDAGGGVVAELHAATYKKLTAREESALRGRLFAEVFRAGLSTRKLQALELLRDRGAFVFAGLIEPPLLRAWCRIAVEGDAREQTIAREHVLPFDLNASPHQAFAALIGLLPEGERAAVTLAWATAALHRRGDRAAAVRALETLAVRDDGIGARSLFELAAHACHGAERDRAFALSARLLAHPAARAAGDPRSLLRTLWKPSVVWRRTRGDRQWLRLRDTSALTWTLRPHRFDAVTPEAMLATPSLAWSGGVADPTGPTGEARVFRALGRAYATFVLPPHRGTFTLDLALTAPHYAPWASVFGDAPRPTAKDSGLLRSAALDAVLSLTETAAQLWVVDRDRRAPISDFDVTFYTRDATGPAAALPARTDADGLARVSFAPRWQVGALVRRKGDLGAEERAFLTHGHDLIARRPAAPEARTYVWLSRPLYRPGETVQGKVIGRTRAFGIASRPRAHTPCALEVVDARGRKLTDVSAWLNGRGAAAFSFALPASTSLGRYTFRLAGAQGAVVGAFQVEEFVAPEFRASLAAESHPRWRSPLALRFEAAYFFGAPVADADVTLAVTRRPWTYHVGSSWPPSRYFGAQRTLRPVRFKTDGAGRARVELPWRGPWVTAADGCDFELTATLRDASGKSCDATLTVSVPRDRAMVSATLDDALRLPGEPLTLTLHWKREPDDTDDARPLSLEFSRALGLVRTRATVMVRPGDRGVTASVALSPGGWWMRAGLAGQRAVLARERVWVLGEGLSAGRYGMVVLSRPSAAPGERLRAALIGHAPGGVMVANAGRWIETHPLKPAGDAQYCELTVPAGEARTLHVKGWSFDADGGLIASDGRATLASGEPPLDRAPASVQMAFSSEVLPPGSETGLSVFAPDASGELVCSVIDEALYALVDPPADPVAFFEATPKGPEDLPAYSVDAAHGTYGRVQSPPVAAFAMAVQGPAPAPPTALGGAIAKVPQRASMPLPAPMMAAPSSAPMPMASRSRGIALFDGSSDDEAPAAVSVPVESPEAPAAPLRSDFSSEAAWHPAAPFGAQGVTLAVKLSDALTTWKATALALTDDQRVGYAEARVKTQRDLNVRLQLPRFLQERDAFALVALVDSRMDAPREVRVTLHAPALTMDAAPVTATVAAGGQAKVSREATVGAHDAATATVRAEAVCEGASDAEARAVPYRAYGVEQVVTLRGALEDGATVALTLPTERRRERTALTLTIDRGPLDAVSNALGYLREYPYGSVEQTCSKIVPHLVWAKVMGERPVDPQLDPYRAQAQGYLDAVLADSLARVAAMQGSDGGYGWFAGCAGDVAMTAWVVFTLALGGKADPSATQRACGFLSARLLDARNPDDADAAAVFALAWAGATVAPRAFEVLLERWDSLRLPERAKLCWALVALRRDEADGALKRAVAELAPHAKRLTKRAEALGDDARWFSPTVTEAVAILVLALLRAGAAEAGRGELKALAAFLMLQQNGTFWHGTRATALAVLALLEFDARTEQRAAGAGLRWTINGHDRGGLALEGVTPSGGGITVGDEALRDGENTVALATEATARTPLALPRFYGLALRLFSTEDDIPAMAEGIVVTRAYRLLDERRRVGRTLASGERVAVGQRLRVELTVRAKKPVRYVLIEDPKLAGCEPVAKTSGRSVCEGDCAHVELRAERTAVFVERVGEQAQTLAYEVEAVVAGRFSAMPARAEALYASDVRGATGSFKLTVG